jgi:hypothetical protein
MDESPPPTITDRIMALEIGEVATFLKENPLTIRALCARISAKQKRRFVTRKAKKRGIRVWRVAL